MHVWCACNSYATYVQKIFCMTIYSYIESDDDSSISSLITTSSSASDHSRPARVSYPLQVSHRWKMTGLGKVKVHTKVLSLSLANSILKYYI